MSEGVGFFGKLPALGDFVRRGLAREVVEPWDRWLQAALDAAGRRLGDAWLAAYLTGPVWRFALAPGVCGPESLAGVLMPSVDRAGRYFPLTLAAALPGRPPLLGLVAGAGGWYDALEAAGRDTLEEALDPGGLAARLAALGPPAVIARPGGCGATGETGWRVSWSREAVPPALPGDGALVEAVLDRVGEGITLWWTLGSERVAPSLAVCVGLPCPEGFAAMLDGGWRDHGWHDFGGSAEAAA